MSSLLNTRKKISENFSTPDTADTGIISPKPAGCIKNATIAAGAIDSASSLGKCEKRYLHVFFTYFTATLYTHIKIIATE